MSRILIGGIGNIFEGDDAFGVEVVRHLSIKALPQDVDLIDFGIRGVDLAYALTSGYDMVVLLDAAPCGEAPGTVSVVEPRRGKSEQIMVAHNLDPASVMRLISNAENACEKIVLVLCEPQTLGGEDGVMGLSPPVAAAIGPASAAVERIVQSYVEEKRPPE